MNTDLQLVPMPPNHQASPIGVMTTANAAAPLEQLRGRVEAALFGTAPALTSIGRFRIIEEVGAGGMGVVYAAHDPQLDRTIALKVLHQRARSPEARARMVREAKAMARLRHPNVLTVFETGAQGEQVYIAMELVEGGTLRQWMERDSEQRSWREVVETIAQAGRGLAAAHDEGLVHRDFKPANALIDDAGRVLVSDFGLARLGSEAPLALASPALSAGALERTEVEDDDERSRDLLRATLTRTGALLGTPAYMSPEQFARDHATARSDQFAFCVVLYEALFGRRPFAGRSVGELIANIERGAIVKPDHARRVPAAVLAVIERGLSHDPADRFASMHLLLDALERATSHRRPRWLAPAAISAVAMTGGFGVLISGQDAASSASACAELERGTLALWDDARRDAIQTALSSALGEAAGERFARLNDTLTRYAGQLARAQRERCEELGERDAAAPAASMVDVCLEDRRSALEQLVQATSSRAEGSGLLDPSFIKAAGIEHADVAASMLPSLAACDLRYVHEALGEQPTPEARRREAELSLAMAGALRPRALTLRPHLDEVETRALDEHRRARVSTKARVALELELAHAALVHQHADPDDRESTGARYRDLASIALRAERAGDHETRARAWALAAELLEAGEHSEVALQQAISQGLAALDSLPAAHTLQRPLRRDLGVIALTHVGHVTVEDSCVQAVDNPSCKQAFQAVNILGSISKAPDELDREAADASLDAALFAKATLRVDPSSVSASARAAADALELRSLPYLDFSAGALVPAQRMPEFTLERHEHDENLQRLSQQLSCTETLCRLDRAFVETLRERPEDIVANARIIPVRKDGVQRGFKLYALRGGTILKQLRFKNGDGITAINGAPLTSVEALADPFGPAQKALRGDAFTLTVTRKGETTERRFEVVETLDKPEGAAPRDAAATTPRGASETDEVTPEAGASTASVPPNPELAHKLTQVTCAAPGERCAMPRALVKELVLDNPSALAPGFRMKGIVDDEGDRRGLQLTTFSETSLAWALGLRPGDILQVVHGINLTEAGIGSSSRSEIAAIINSIGTAARVDVEYERGGEARRLVVAVTE